MVLLLLAMVICLGLAAAVLGLVAVPARREGRPVLTERGEDTLDAVKGSVRDRVDSARRGRR